MGCVPSLPHPCSQKEEARFTFVYNYRSMAVGVWMSPLYRLGDRLRRGEKGL